MLAAGALAALALAPPPAAPVVDTGEAARSPTLETKACKGCHGGWDAKPSVHLVFAEGECTDCHAPSRGAGRCRSPAARGWTLTQKTPAGLCTSCHAPADHAAKAPLQHEPVKAGRCVECHDPHASDLPHLVRAKGKALCLRCHDARRPGAKVTLDLKRKHVHPALDGGDCGDCHAVGHGGSAPRFLVKPAAELCRDCHEPKGGPKSTHTAVTEGRCTGCHDPHATDLPALVRRPLEQLCRDCHDPDKQVKKPVEHAPVAEGRCHDCHAAHGSQYPSLLVEAGSKLCLRCHDAKAAPGKSGPGPDARIDLTPGKVHPALEGVDCQHCHVAGHSGELDRLLARPAPELCAGCHDPKDGKRYVHGAVKAGKCASCHDPHASGHPHLLRAATVQETCFRCHDDDVRRRPRLHEPVAQGDCGACHDPHSADGRKLLTRGTGKLTCYGCHSSVDEGSVRHAAVRRHGCNGCHDAHGSPNAALLPKKVNALCAVCHPGQKDGVHALRRFGGNHPVDGKPDPRREGKELSCASCHDPHSSNHPLLFRSGDSSATMCDGCHGNISGKNPGDKDLVRRARPEGPGGGAAPEPPAR